MCSQTGDDAMDYWILSKKEHWEKSLMYRCQRFRDIMQSVFFESFWESVWKIVKSKVEATLFLLQRQEIGIGGITQENY